MSKRISSLTETIGVNAIAGAAVGAGFDEHDTAAAR